MSLGAQSTSVVSPGTFQTTSADAGEVCRIVGVLAGCFILLFSFWFFCISTVAVCKGIYERQMSFTLNWWAFVFPNGGLTLAIIQFADAFNSPVTEGIASAFTIALVIMWLVCAVANVWALWQGTVMWPGKDEDKDMKGIRWGRAAA